MFMFDSSSLEQIGTQTDLANLVGISQQAVHDLLKRGVIRKGDTLAVWLRAYLAQLRRVAGRHGDGGPDSNDLTRARIREANAKAFKAEVETGKELGLLVYQHAVEPALRSWAARGAMAIDGAERRIVDTIQSEFGIQLEDRHVRDHLRAAQRDIAAYADELGGDAEASGEGMGPARTGTDG